MYKLLLLPLLFLMNCKTTPPTGDTTPPSTPDNTDYTKCITDGYVKDFTGLDGCKLLVLVGDEKWLISRIPKGHSPLQDKQTIKFGYKDVVDGISICMAEDKIVEIVCLEIVNQGRDPKPGKKECVNTSTPKKVDWMKRLIGKHQPIQITKYPFRGDGWAYLFRTDKAKLLYTCQGHLVCESALSDKDNSCYKTYLQYLRDEEVVYRGEGNN